MQWCWAQKSLPTGDNKVSYVEPTYWVWFSDSLRVLVWSALSVSTPWGSFADASEGALPSGFPLMEAKCSFQTTHSLWLCPSFILLRLDECSEAAFASCCFLEEAEHSMNATDSLLLSLFLVFSLPGKARWTGMKDIYKLICKCLFMFILGCVFSNWQKCTLCTFNWNPICTCWDGTAVKFKQ